MTSDSTGHSREEERMPSGGVRGFAPGVVRRARSERGLSLRELAALLDLSVQAVTAWEQGRSTPAPRHFLALAKALHVTVDDLIRIPITEADLVSLRDRAGMTGTEVAAELDIHKSAFSEIEHGYRRLPARLVQPLARIYQRPESMITAAWERGRADLTRRARN